MLKKTLVLGALVVVAMAMASCASEEVNPEIENVVMTSDELGKADKLDCSLVRCALPLCSEGQHLAYQGSCCPTCVGNAGTSRCATVLCAAVVCAEDEQAVTPKGQCCPQCVKKPSVKECQSDSDCPQYYCIQCPCPYSTCQGQKCVTQTPDSSTCGGAL